MYFSIFFVKRCAQPSPKSRGPQKVPSHAHPPLHPSPSRHPGGVLLTCGPEHPVRAAGPVDVHRHREPLHRRPQHVAHDQLHSALPGRQAGHRALHLLCGDGVVRPQVLRPDHHVHHPDPHRVCHPRGSPYQRGGSASNFFCILPPYVKRPICRTNNPSPHPADQRTTFQRCPLFAEVFLTGKPLV